MVLSRRCFGLACAALAMGGSLRGSLLAAPALPKSQAYQRLLADYQKRHRRFTTDVEKLADEVEASGLSADAAALRERAPSPDPRSLKLDELPTTIIPSVPASLPAAEQEWRLRLRGLESDLALDLFRLGNRAKVEGQYSLAWRFVREAAYRNPDNPQARATLGFVRLGNEWTTPFRKQMLDQGFVWHRQFGWLRADDVSRYEAGERRAWDGRWVSRERDAAERSDFSRAWEVNSEHFHVRSNHSLERAVEISVQMERFHEYFVREFAAVFMTPQQMRKLFEGAGRSVSAKRHIVHYYRTQKEFQDRLMARQPEAAYSHGLYRTDDHVAYFFDRPGHEEEVAETMYHEVTHQILSESATKTVVANNWADGDFWLVEGLACYLESYKPEGRGASVGDPRHPRIDWARKFLVESRFFIPLEKFTSLSQRDFQCADLGNGPDRIDRLQKHYSQAAGVTHFFMHFDDGKYRDSLIAYLAQIYSADQRIRRNSSTLAELTGVPFAELDRQYVQYIAELQGAAG